MAALSGSWIGGTANMLAIQESVGLRDLGPIIVVDTVVGYGWMGVLLFLSPYQARFDRWVGADTRAMDRVNATLAQLDQTRRPATTDTLAIIVGVGFAAAVASRLLGARLPSLGDPTIVSAGTWAVLIAVTAGLALSFTPARRLEADGASRVGYAGLYLLLTSIGAQANLAAVLDAPLYLLAGVVWLAFHIALMFGAARLFRAPLFFVATGSMANVGGAASAPVVAGVYHPAMAPVGLLMAVAGLRARHLRRAGLRVDAGATGGLGRRPTAPASARGPPRRRSTSRPSGRRSRRGTSCPTPGSGDGR